MKMKLLPAYRTHPLNSQPLYFLTTLSSLQDCFRANPPSYTVAKMYRCTHLLDNALQATAVLMSAKHRIARGKKLYYSMPKFHIVKLSANV
jgi:hypothetical protein